MAKELAKGWWWLGAGWRGLWTATSRMSSQSLLFFFFFRFLLLEELVNLIWVLHFGKSHEHVNRMMQDEGFDFDMPDLQELASHFSYYAFEGKTGQRHWSHESGDFLNNEAGPMEEVRVTWSDVSDPLICGVLNKARSCFFFLWQKSISVSMLLILYINCK